MSSFDFRQITIKGEAQKAERLFRAAVSAFCSLTRPSRRDQTQLEDLTLPLFDLVTVEARRYVAAALSECPSAPSTLVKRLCNESVDIAAPLLIRSAGLSDFDLIALIGRHGAGHARAIARRTNLNPAIASLAAALGRKAEAARTAEAQAVQKAADPELPTSGPVPTTGGTAPAHGAAAENMRRKLRSVMRPQEPNASSTKLSGPPYPRLRDTALTGSPALFQTALANSLGLEFATAREIASPSSYSWLLTALRALDCNGEQAFLVTAAVCPKQFPQAEAIRLFLARYGEMTREIALERLAVWKSRTPAEDAEWRQLPSQQNQAGDTAFSRAEAK